MRRRSRKASALKQQLIFEALTRRMQEKAAKDPVIRGLVALLEDEAADAAAPDKPGLLSRALGSTKDSAKANAIPLGVGAAAGVAGGGAYYYLALKKLRQAKEECGADAECAAEINKAIKNLKYKAALIGLGAGTVGGGAVAGGKYLYNRSFAGKGK